jgi:hypothetical protein
VTLLPTASTRPATSIPNLDTYERIIPEDAQKSAIIVAAAVYELAMRDDMLPRFTAAEMPPPPPPAPGEAPRAATPAAGTSTTPKQK